MITFTIDDEQVKKLNEWLAARKSKYTGAIGGRYTFTFHDTTLGTVVKVIDETNKEEIDLTNYLEW